MLSLVLSCTQHHRRDVTELTAPRRKHWTPRHTHTHLSPTPIVTLFLQLQAEREFRSRLPPPAGSSSSLLRLDDLDIELDLAEVGGIVAGSNHRAKENDDRVEKGCAIVDWVQTEERKGDWGGDGSREGGAAAGPEGAQPVLESVGDRAEYESTLAALKVTLLP